MFEQIKVGLFIEKIENAQDFIAKIKIQDEIVIIKIKKKK